MSLSQNGETDGYVYSRDWPLKDMAMKKRKILVVDDEVDFLDLLKMRLEANNYEVVASGDGNDGLAKFRKGVFDAVLLDIMMPGIDGIVLLKKIRESDADIPVFMITAFSNEERMRAANQLNASGYILKTNDLQSEIDNITGILEVAGRHAEKEGP